MPLNSEVILPNKMEEFWILILVAFLATNSFEQAGSVELEELEELPLQTFDELFVEEWWDKDEAEEWHKLTFEHNFHHQIDRQNTQLGQIEPNSTDQLGQIKPNSTDQLGQIKPNSTDQLGQIEPNSTDQLGQIKPNSTDQLRQIEPNSTDQNPPLTESDHSTERMKEITSNENNAEEKRKRKIVDNFLAIKEEFKQKGKYSKKEWTQIDQKISRNLKVSRSKIYKWKKEFGLSRKMHNFGKIKEERKHLIGKFDQIKAELKRDGFKNSYNHEIDKTVAKELGFCLATIYAWKHELGQITPNHKYSHCEQKELMKRYYEIKDQNPLISDEKIAKMLKIGSATLTRWKKQFKRQQFHSNSVDERSVEENAAANVQLGKELFE